MGEIKPQLHGVGLGVDSESSIFRGADLFLTSSTFAGQHHVILGETSVANDKQDRVAIRAP